HVSTVCFVTLAVAAIGALIGWLMFRHDVPARAPATKNPLTMAGRNDLFGDAFNETVFMRTGQGLVSGLVSVDQRGIDGAVNSGSAALGGLSDLVGRWQNGYVRSYALTMVVGSALVGVVIILTRMS
ncbi:MAG: NADH-quinone oxidoreductase subunit L, partial [Propionibacteriaceae bacterium]